MIYLWMSESVFVCERAIQKQVWVYPWSICGWANHDLLVDGRIQFFFVKDVQGWDSDCRQFLPQNLVAESETVNPKPETGNPVQDWDSIGDGYWLKHGVELILSMANMEARVQEATDSPERVSSIAAELKGKRSAAALEAFAANDAFLNQQYQTTTGALLTPLCELLHNSNALTHAIWTQVKTPQDPARISLSCSLFDQFFDVLQRNKKAAKDPSPCTSRNLTISGLWFAAFPHDLVEPHAGRAARAHQAPRDAGGAGLQQVPGPPQAQRRAGASRGHPPM